MLAVRAGPAVAAGVGVAVGRRLDRRSVGHAVRLSDPDSFFPAYPLLGTLSLQLYSAVTGSYVSGIYSVIFVNCPNEQIARDIARFFWNGEMEEATEILLLIKTKASNIHMLSNYIRLVHPFEIPEVFSLPVDQGDVHYLRWLEKGMDED